MGNYFALCKFKNKCSAGVKKNPKVLQVVKMDGNILEFTAPVIVKDLLVKFSGFGIAVSGRLSLPLPPTCKLKMGKIYYLLPPDPTSTMVETKEACGIKRIKVVITKQQLQELLSKQISVEDVLPGGVERRRTRSSVDSPPTFWKPKLEPIPE